MNELIEAFRADKCERLGWSEKSGRAYACHLRGFVGWLTGKLGRAVEPGDMTADQVMYFDTLRKRAGRAQRTRAAALAAFQSFARWLYEAKRIGLEQCAAIREIKVKVTERPRKRWATKDEVQSLFAACPNLVDGRSEQQQYRQYLGSAVLAILAYTGLRRGELCGLRVDDLDMKSAMPTIRVRHGKGSKSRSLPLHPHAVKHLALWLENRPMQHDYLFAVPVYAPDGRPTVRVMSEQRMRGLLVTLCKVAGIDQGIPLSPHSFRRFAGTNLMKVKGCTLKHIQEFYGHSDPRTSLEYLGIDQQELYSLIGSMNVETEVAAPIVQPDPRIRRAVQSPRHAAFRRTSR